MNIFYLTALLFILNVVYLQNTEASFLFKWFCYFKPSNPFCPMLHLIANSSLKFHQCNEMRMNILYMTNVLFILYLLWLPSTDSSLFLCLLGFTSFCPDPFTLLKNYINKTLTAYLSKMKLLYLE
ncbi:unnamed protein product [Schistosoma turkestanicum]|nr:unnamed protein product [Schistosoma turkestanicum]